MLSTRPGFVRARVGHYLVEVIPFFHLASAMRPWRGSWPSEGCSFRTDNSGDTF